MEKRKNSEDELYELYDNGVSPNSRFFKNKLVEFKQTFQINELDIRCNIMQNYTLSSVDLKIINEIIKNEGCIITSACKFAKSLNMRSSYLSWRLIILDSKNIIKVNTYGRTKVIYLR